MNDKELICFVDMFTFSQSAFIEVGEGERLVFIIDSSKIEKDLKDICIAKDINIIHLYGDKNYIEALVPQGSTEYNNKEIEVRIN